MGVFLWISWNVGGPNKCGSTVLFCVYKYRYIIRINKIGKEQEGGKGIHDYFEAKRKKIVKKFLF